MPKPRAMHRKARYQRSATDEEAAAAAASSATAATRDVGHADGDFEALRFAGQSYLDELVTSAPPPPRLRHRQAPTLSTARPLNTGALINELVYFHTARKA